MWGSLDSGSFPSLAEEMYPDVVIITLSISRTGSPSLPSLKQINVSRMIANIGIFWKYKLLFNKILHVMLIKRLSLTLTSVEWVPCQPDLKCDVELHIKSKKRLKIISKLINGENKNARTTKFSAAKTLWNSVVLLQISAGIK